MAKWDVLSIVCAVLISVISGWLYRCKRKFLLLAICGISTAAVVAILADAILPPVKTLHTYHATDKPLRCGDCRDRTESAKRFYDLSKAILLGHTSEFEGRLHLSPGIGTRIVTLTTFRFSSAGDTGTYFRSG